MKNLFLKKKVNRPLLVLGVLFISISSCDNETGYDEIPQLAYIEIEDFDNPETMWEQVNKDLYNEAYDRFMAKTRLENGLYSYDLRSGAEIGISEPIFQYIRENVEYLNSQIEDDKAVLLEENGEILFSVKNLKKSFGNFTTLQETPHTVRISVSHLPIFQTAGGRLAGQVSIAMTNYKNGHGGNVGEYFTWNNFAYNRTGSTTFAGVPVTYHVSSSTSIYSETNPNNTFVSFRETQSGNYTYFEIRLSLIHI